MELGALSQPLHDVWTYELVNIDGQSIRVGTLLVAGALVALGYRVSRWASRLLGRLLVKRLRIEQGPAEAIESLTFYALFVVVAVTALRFIHFPLTAFTVVGGALAIGLGFGSQNVMSNFISGLILMFERPIRPGDLIEVQGTYGYVEQMGARSTRIRAGNNTQIIVPNSFFLENHVVNFTLSDDVLRSQVNVGVAYGSPTREVARLIRRVLDQHPSVLKSPEPRVIFADFGDNALLFEAYFWLRARVIMDRRLVESEVRFSLAELFHESGIVVAFPQRDVHLDTLRPLEVRLTSDPGTSDTE